MGLLTRRQLSERTVSENGETGFGSTTKEGEKRDEKVSKDELITDAEEFKTLLARSETTKNLFFITCRFGIQNCPKDVFEDLWKCFQEREKELIKRGQPPVDSFLPFRKKALERD